MNEIVRQNPRQLVTLLNWTKRWSEWKRRISRRASIVFLLCYLLLLERIGMKSSSSRTKGKVEVFGEKTMWMWFWFFIRFWSEWNVERIGSEIMWVWMLNPCIPHWKSYNKKELMKKVFVCLFGIIHRDSIAQQCTVYWFIEVAVVLHGGMEIDGLDEDEWVFVWISAILLEQGMIASNWMNGVEVEWWWKCGWFEWVRR